eukprot:s133_g22.t1
MEDGEADQVISSYAQWLVNCLSEHRAREEVLSKEITAVREAAAVGATALVELRAAVQDQLDNVARQLGRLAQDLEATKVELAEVVIEKEEDEGELKREETQLHALEKKLTEASEREVALKQELEAKVVAAEDRVLQSLGDFPLGPVVGELCALDVEFPAIPGVVESHMMKLFEKFDISMKTQLEQLREAQVALQSQLQTQHRGAQSKEEGIRRIVEECDRKLLELASQMTMEKEANLMTPNQGSVKFSSLDTESLHASGRNIVKADPQTPASISVPVAPVTAPATGSGKHGAMTAPVTAPLPAPVTASLPSLGTPVASNVPPITLAMGTPQNIVTPAYTTDRHMANAVFGDQGVVSRNASCVASLASVSVSLSLSLRELLLKVFHEKDIGPTWQRQDCPGSIAPL